MQRLEVSGVLRLIYRSLGVKGLSNTVLLRTIRRYLSLIFSPKKKSQSPSVDTFCLQKCFNGRLKGLHFLNAPPFVDSAVTLVKSVLKPKLAARVSTSPRIITNIRNGQCEMSVTLNIHKVYNCTLQTFPEHTSPHLQC